MHRGQLSLNDAAFAGLGSPEAVELMYSSSDRLIGIRPVDPAEPHAYVPRTAAKNKGRGPHIISGAAFFSHFDVKVEQTTRYMATIEGGVLIVDLKTPGTPVAAGQGSSEAGSTKRGRS